MPTAVGRAAGLLLLYAGELLYVPINRTVQGGTELKTPWDGLLPVWPIWAVPYTLAIVWWIGSFAWAACRMDETRWRAFVAAALLTMLSAYAVYIVWPTYIVRPEPGGDSWASGLLRSIYAHDDMYNAFPSGHVYNTMLIVFFWWDWQPRLRRLWAGLAVVVVLSTLFTQQHYLLDPLGGIVWAWLGCRGGWWLARRGPWRAP